MSARNLAERYLVSVLVIALAIGVQAEIWADRIEGPRAVLVVAGLLYTLPLLASRSHPLAAAITVFAALAIQSFFDTEVTNNSPVPFVAALAAFFLVAFYAEHKGALIGLGVGVAAVVIVGVNEASMDAPEMLVTSLICGAIWLAGFALRIRLERSAQAEERAERAERERDTAAELAVAKERSRISRELHDIVAHSVSVMVLQTGAVRRRLSTDQEEERQALLAVESTGRQALGEMRQLLGVMRAQGEAAETAPQPGLDQVATLIEQTRRAGLPVELSIEGEPDALPQSVDVSAFRIVQEGLTNALKHAGHASAAVRLRYADDGIEITVSDDGQGPAPGTPGHGLIGIRERVKLFGGDLDAGPREGGGYVLRARLPTIPRES